MKHVLLGWKDLAPFYARRGGIDARAKDRSNADAAKLAKDVLAQLKANPAKIDELVTPQLLGESGREDRRAVRGPEGDTPFVRFKNTRAAPEG